MGERTVADEPKETYKLRLLSFPVHSPDHDASSSSGCATPPLFHHTASVPFKWEQEPGKPIPCTALIPFTKPISMELKLIPPPRLSWPVDRKLAAATTTKTHSPTTVLDGPEPERGLLGPMVMSHRENKGHQKKAGTGRSLFGSWSWGRNSRMSGKMGKRDQAAAIGGSFVLPSSASSACSFDDGRECCSEFGEESEAVDQKVKMSKIKKSKFFQSFTQIMPWKGSKLKKDGAATATTST